jgi:hypothetical protein
MLEASNETKIALLEQAVSGVKAVQEKQDNINMSLITTVQDIKTKFWVLGVAFPVLISLLGLLKSFGVFGK